MLNPTDVLVQNPDATTGLIIGPIVSGLMTAVPGAESLPLIVHVVVPILAGLIPVLAKRFLFGNAASARTKMMQKRAKAAAKRADGKAALALAGATQATVDAGNKLIAEADALDAQADDLEADAARDDALAGNVKG